MRSYDQVYDFTGFTIEARHLFKQNNQELDFFGLDVGLDLDMYSKLDTIGALKVFTVRDDGELIGYCTFIIQKHLQHKEHKQASQDVLFIQKDKRGYGTEFMKWCDSQLKESGISFVFRSVTQIKDWSLILKRLNYKQMETIYMKDLRE